MVDVVEVILAICHNCKRTKSVCKACKRCASCEHTCWWCLRCDERHSRPKCFCGACSKWCTCRKMRGRRQGVTWGRAIDCAINHLKRPVGVEFEVAELNGFNKWYHPKVEGNWGRDGTVDPSGMEFRTDPMTGDKFVAMMYHIAQGMKDYECTVNSTCGFHVHVDGTDMGIMAMRNLLTLWAALEEEIFAKLCAPARLGNKYCRTMKREIKELFNMWGSTTENPSAMRKRFFDWLYTTGVVDGKSIKERRGIKDGRLRYYSLNLNSWAYRGTVEFRLKEGLVDGWEAVGWSLFCGWLVEMAVNLPYETIKNIEDLKSLLEVRAPGLEGLERVYYLPRVNPVTKEASEVRGWLAEKLRDTRQKCGEENEGVKKTNCAVLPDQDQETRGCSTIRAVPDETETEEVPF